ncbi:hypothetical protein NN561_018198 [Cricetulus griseus]
MAAVRGLPEWAEGELRRGRFARAQRTLPRVGRGDSPSWELGGGLGRAALQRRRPPEPSGLRDEGRPVCTHGQAPSRPHHSLAAPGAAGSLTPPKVCQVPGPRGTKFPRGRHVGNPRESCPGLKLPVCCGCWRCALGFGGSATEGKVGHLRGRRRV